MAKKVENSGKRKNGTLALSARSSTSIISKGTDIKMQLRGKRGANPRVFIAHEKGIVRWLGGSGIIGIPIVSDYDVLMAGESGIPKQAIDHLAGYIGISRKSMADVFEVSIRTLERKAPTTKLDKKTSSHALEIAKVMQHAFNVFEDEEKSKMWVNRRNRALNGKKPVEFFGTLTGLSMVNDVLGRIEDGVYS